MKIGVVGAGQVGSASAYACVLREVGSEIVLVDKNPDYAVGQAEDILHAAPFAAACSVRAGDIDDLDGAAVVMIAAGVPQRDASESRLELLKRNADVFRDLVPRVLTAAPDAVLLIASNPVDVMTDFAARMAAEAGVQPSRVIGSGTILDTARYRALLGQHLRVSSQSVHAYVVGEHGDSEVLVWSSAEVGGMDLEEAARQLGRPINGAERDRIDAGVRRAAHRIIERKGATWFGIGAGMARIAEAVIDDHRAALTCCVRAASVAGVENATCSLPRIVGAQGVLATLAPPLAEAEQAALRRSAEIVADAAAELD